MIICPILFEMKKMLFKTVLVAAFLLFAGTVHAAPQECTTLDPTNMESSQQVTDKNVLGETLQLCCSSPKTGFYRNGFCQTGVQDVGTHIVCAEVTDAFLEFTKSRGNDLSTPRPAYNFPGLKEGDRWCLCASRWVEALEAGLAPKVDLNATHEKMRGYVELEVLKKYSVDE